VKVFLVQSLCRDAVVRPEQVVYQPHFVTRRRGKSYRKIRMKLGKDLEV
jgi:hypothetical protein